MTKVRFSFSPANEAMAWLKATAKGNRHPVFGDPGPVARAAFAHPDVALVASLVPPPGVTYVPDLLTPQPGVGNSCSELFDEQLATIEATSQDELEYQLCEGIEENWGRAAPAWIQRAAESGQMQRRLASGLVRFWRETLAEMWPTLQSVIDQDIANRGMKLVARGLGYVLNTAHPGVAWAGDAISLDKGWTGEIDITGRDLVLALGVLTWPDLLVQGPDEAVLYLPAQRIGTGIPRSENDLGGVIGDARALLLAELEEARSTTDLARRLGYTPGTISYHLSAMHRAGLVTKSRDGRYVLYKRTPQARALLSD